MPHLLGLRGLPVERLRRLLSRARDLIPSVEGEPPPALLRGRSVANLFFEDSTRTRLSFSIAARRMGAEILDLTGPGSSVSKGETLLDTALNVRAMGVDAMVIRHSMSGAAETVARQIGPGRACAILNAGDGRHEHPTQGLLDTLTIAEALGRLADFDLRGLRLVIVGDVANSRVARSDIAAWTALGAEAVCVGPPGLCPPGMAALGCATSHDLDAALVGADAVQALRIQVERSPAIPSLRDYTAGHQISAERVARMKPGAVVMHPGPMNRGVEITGDVADGPRSRVLRQVTLGVATRMACLAECLGA